MKLDTNRVQEHKKNQSRREPDTKSVMRPIQRVKGFVAVLTDLKFAALSSCCPFFLSLRCGGGIRVEYRKISLLMIGNNCKAATATSSFKGSIFLTSLGSAVRPSIEFGLGTHRAASSRWTIRVDLESFLLAGRMDSTTKLV